MKPTTREVKAKTPGEVISVLKAEVIMWEGSWSREKHRVDCLKRAIAIVRLWDANITRADVRAERKRKGRAKT